MKRLLSILLLVAMFSSLASCGNENSDVSETENALSDVTNEPEEETETEDTRIQPDIPDTTYDGASFRFLSRQVTDGVVRYYSEISSSELNGEIMNDAIFNRTARLEAKYQIDIVDENHENVAEAFKNSYQAGEQNWDVVVPSFAASLNLAQGGFNADWKQMPYIDLEKPWWDTNVAKAMEITGSVYSVIGAMNTWTDSHTYAVIFNKELCVDFEIAPYDMVRNNEWTLDNFNGILEKVGSDLDGNGTIDENDRFGAVGEKLNFSHFVLAADICLVSKDEEGYPVVDVPEKFYTVAEKVCIMMTGNNYMIAENYYNKYSDPWHEGIRPNFRAGNSMFFVGGIEHFLIFRDLDIDIGLLPMPKLEEGQKNYSHTFNPNHSGIMIIPRNSATTEFTGHMLEALQAESYYSTAVDYYDVILARKTMRDEESCEMLNIIRASRTIDPELAYNFMGAYGFYNNVLDQKSTDSLASAVASTARKAEKMIEKLIKQYQD